MVTTIYKIQGGFQAARQAVQAGQPVVIETVDNSDWPVLAKCHGQMSYTNVAWSTVLDRLEQEAREWCAGYGEVKFSYQ